MRPDCWLLVRIVNGTLSVVPKKSTPSTVPALPVKSHSVVAPGAVQAGMPLPLIVRVLPLLPLATTFKSPLASAYNSLSVVAVGAVIKLPPVAKPPMRTPLVLPFICSFCKGAAMPIPTLPSRLSDTDPPLV